MLQKLVTKKNWKQFFKGKITFLLSKHMWAYYLNQEKICTRCHKQQHKFSYLDCGDEEYTQRQEWVG